MKADHKLMWDHLKKGFGDLKVGSGKLLNIMESIEVDFHNKSSSLDQEEVKEILSNISNPKRTVKIKTSYFSNYRKFDGYTPVSISNTQPPNCDFDNIKELTPSMVDVVALKHGKMNEDLFTERYIRKLMCLDNEVLDRILKPKMVLLCWEKGGKFCHRHILNYFLSNVNKSPNVEYIVEEL